MRLEYLCKLEFFYYDVEDALLNITAVNRYKTDNMNADITKKADIMLNRLGEEFRITTNVYYELESNLLEAKNKADVIALYRRILSNLEFKEEPGLTEKALNKAQQNGLISLKERRIYKQKFMKLWAEWSTILEFIEDDINTAESKGIRKEKTRRDMQEPEHAEVSLTDKEIQVVSRLSEYFKYDGSKWVFIAKDGHGYKWEELAIIFSTIHGTQFYTHESRLKKYFDARWKRRRKEPKDGMGEARVSNKEERIKFKVNSILT